MADPIIYCVEGHWNYGDHPSSEPSVEPLLQMLQQQGLWTYVRRNAATDHELFYWMKNEWNYCEEGSILYFATHGEPGAIWLGSDQPSSGVPIEKLAMEIDCSGCLVHFSGCSTLPRERDRIQLFLEESGASAVSGYREEVGWTSRSLPPAALLDLMLFSVIRDEKIRIKLTDKRSRGKLLSLKEELQTKFPKCGFDLYSKWDFSS